MSAREDILAALRRARPPRVELPEAGPGLTYADPVAQFLETSRAIGAAAVYVPEAAELSAALDGLEPLRTAGTVVSLVPGIGPSNVDLATVRDPHELEPLDAAIVPGAIGVAENGAVWLAGESLGPHRVIFVIPKHLVLVVPATAIVSNMQQAYERLTVARPGFGTWVAGPSKTADIEQALVIGAQGPLSCSVVVVGTVLTPAGPKGYAPGP